jgi:hypothetical protein
MDVSDIYKYIIIIKKKYHYPRLQQIRYTKVSRKIIKFNYKGNLQTCIKQLQTDIIKGVH